MVTILILVFKKKLNGHGNFANKIEIELQNLKVLGTTQHFLLEQLCANKLHFKVQSLSNCFKRYHAKQNNFNFFLIEIKMF